MYNTIKIYLYKKSVFVYTYHMVLALKQGALLIFSILLVSFFNRRLDIIKTDISKIMRNVKYFYP
ncbi:hypothetical protein EDM02_05070 [Candidatus Cardinium hertigii]|uniref:Uncharacterized protein n=1 Tax=Candidatus Cardinium hertigii TaxID=247481 RepID=A0A3N2QAY4_9BACT|nr:hypothetical protein EDM02_05070 [Candidatus Cardinium hertigii]